MGALQGALTRLRSIRVPDALLHRLVGLALALPTATVLGIAAWLHPNPAGVGTHRQLGLEGCVVLTLTGVPCPMCGMTTTFALMADGRLLDALANQPFGVVLFLATMGGLVVGFWDLISARGAWRGVLAWVLERETAVALTILVGLLAGWTYKILSYQKILAHLLDG